MDRIGRELPRHPRKGCAHHRRGPLWVRCSRPMKCPSLTDAADSFENTPLGVQEFVEERLKAMTFRPELESKWTLAIVLALAQQVRAGSASCSASRLNLPADRRLNVKRAQQAGRKRRVGAHRGDGNRVCAGNCKTCAGSLLGVGHAASVYCACSAPILSLRLFTAPPVSDVAPPFHQRFDRVAQRLTAVLVHFASRGAHHLHSVRHTQHHWPRGNTCLVLVDDHVLQRLRHVVVEYLHRVSPNYTCGVSGNAPSSCRFRWW